MEKLIEVYDVTTRDGKQTVGVKMDVQTKLNLIQASANFGVDYVEVGWPGANKIDNEIFPRLSDLNLKKTKPVAFGSTRRKGVKPENDKTLNDLLDAETDVVTIFGKNSLAQAVYVLGMKPLENLEAINDSVRLLKSHGRKVQYDAEHFFSGFDEDREYALACLEAALAGGADRLVLCDTIGGFTPEFVYKATRAVHKRFGDAKLGIHVQNDGDMAVSSSIQALRAGVTQIQGAYNGLGERCGNLNLCTFLPTAHFKYNYNFGVDLTQITPLAEYVAEETLFPVAKNASYVGENAFKHSGGVHADAEMKVRGSYQHIDPDLVGNKHGGFDLSDQAGGANVIDLARKHGFSLDKTHPKYQQLV